MSDKAIELDVISDNARRIAQGLGLRDTRQNLPGRIVARIHRLLVNNQSVGIYPRLATICHQIYPLHKRHFLTCLVLLDRLWLVQVGTQAAQDVVRLVRESYHLCDRPSFKAILRDELVEKQWSSFAVVRQAASQIRDIEPVNSSEVEVLRDPRAFSDVRSAIASRILLHRQTEHIGCLLGYLINTVRTGGEDGAEREHATRLLRQLPDFGLAEVLVPLYHAYVEHFADASVRGYLMVALAGLGEALVPQLDALYQGDQAGSCRQPIVRLLRQLIARGSSKATQALVRIVSRARGSELDEAAKHLINGARERAARCQPTEETILIREHLDALVQLLNDKNDKTYEHIVRDLVAINWDGAISAELIERVVAQIATPEERQQLRHGGARATERLLEIIQNESRTTRQRIEALHFLPRIFGTARRPGPEELLWRLYLQSTEEDLRLAALRCLAALQLSPPDPSGREILFEHGREGSKAVQRVIEECWERLYPKSKGPGKLASNAFPENNQ